MILHSTVHRRNTLLCGVNLQRSQCRSLHLIDSVDALLSKFRVTQQIWVPCSKHNQRSIFFSNTGIVMILEIFSFECSFPRDLLSDFEIQMRIRQRRST